MKRWLLIFCFVMLIVTMLSSISRAQDPGLPDSVQVRTIEISQQNPQWAYCTVFIKVDEPIAFFNFPFSIQSAGGFHLDSLIYISPFTEWDEVGDTVVNDSRGSFFGWADLGGEDNPFFNSGYIWYPWCVFVFSVDEDAPFQFVRIDTATFLPQGGLMLGDSLGVLEIHPAFSWGGIQYGPTGIDGPDIQLPTELRLAQNYPNPFNAGTIIEFDLPAESPVQIEVFNMLGQLVATLLDTDYPAGHYAVHYDAHGLSSGVYFYQLNTSGKRLTQRMTIMK